MGKGRGNNWFHGNSGLGDENYQPHIKGRGNRQETYQEYGKRKKGFKLNVVYFFSILVFRCDIYLEYLNVESWIWRGDIFSPGIVCFVHNWNRISIFWWFYSGEEDIIVCNSISAAPELLPQREIMETNIFCRETLLQENVAAGKYYIKKRCFSK